MSNEFVCESCGRTIADYGCPKCGVRYAIGGKIDKENKELLETSEKLRKYLEHTYCKDFDIPDSIYKPWNDAINAIRKNVKQDLKSDEQDDIDDINRELEDAGVEEMNLNDQLNIDLAEHEGWPPEKK